MDLNTITEVARPKRREDVPAWREGDAFLGGGTWLFSEPQVHTTRLIDLAALGWQPLIVRSDGLDIAATCTIAQLNALSAPAEWIVAPLIDKCCKAFLASFKIWNTATVGGNLCMALPAGPMISLTAALEGVCTIWGADGSERRMPVADFVLGPQKNAFKPGELLRSIRIPAAALIRRTAFRQVSLSRNGRSGALLIGTFDPPTSEFVLTVTASTPRPIKFSFSKPPSAADLRGRIEREITIYFDDIHGAPEWRRHMTLHFAEDIRKELTESAR